MSRNLRCARCGLVLNQMLKAVPGTGIIVKVVEPHECLEEPIDLALPTPVITPLEQQKIINRIESFPFVKNLDKGLKTPPSMWQDARDPRDELATSTAPDAIKKAFDIFDEPGEMEG